VRYTAPMATHLEVPLEALSPEALEGLVEEFVTREGTDYGHFEFSLSEKRDRVLGQLRRGEVAIVFEVESESTTLIHRTELGQLGL
jgi:uncharacterized protein